MSSNTDILIIGGGVIGMSTARELSRRGAHVTLIDKGEPGFGCSYGNAGWLTPCFAMPLPMPGMFLKAVGWLLDPESPLYIHPSADPLLARWLWRFMLAMNRKQMLRAVKALTEISKYSLEEYRQLGAAHPEIAFEQKGLLMVGQSEAGVRAAVEEMELVAAHGVPGKFLDEAACKRLEPALTGKIQGGVYFPEEAHAEPLQVVRALRADAEKAGARIISGAEVYDFEFEGRKLKRILTTRGPIGAEKFVLATGSWSHEIARRLSLNVPILGGKGYALIVPPLDPTPGVPLMLVEKKIAVTPRAGTLRLAGTLELVNQDFSISPRRVNAIIRGAREFMNVPMEPEIHELWRGLRPCTPDGVPLIGVSPRTENLYLNAGHQMLGLQSATGCARLCADLVLGATPLWDPDPYRVSRY